MPRLLLVDDNPSIHKIAETLLAPTDIELVCVDSAQAALDLIGQGDRFDVALVDTAMPAMDGWELLNHLRKHPATAAMPIAMMAGVLDNVDPNHIEHPSIQGFLRKPVELRDLGARVHALMEMEVAPPPPVAAPNIEDFSAFSTVPAVKIADLNLSLEAPVAEVPDPPTSDVLVLEESDLWPEAPVSAGTRTEDLSPFAEIPAEEHLDIQEFDFESLRNLTIGTPPVVAPPAAPAPEPIYEPTPEPVFEPVAEAVSEAPLPSAFELFSLEPADPTPSLVVESIPASEPVPARPDSPFDPFPSDSATQELPDLGTEPDPTFDPAAFEDFDAGDQETAEFEIAAPTASAPDPDLLSDLGEVSSASDITVIAWSQAHEPTPTFVPEVPAFTVDHTEPALEIDFAPEAAPIPEPEPEVAAALEPAPEAPVTPLVAMEPSAAAPAASAEAMLQTILDDPALMDRLAKAVVARLGDQTLREIAWEVMPELAERLNRH